MTDKLGERMKGQYEDRYRFSLPRRTYTIIRLDGKAFHTYTRGLNKPFDIGLIVDIDMAIIEMLPEIQGAVFAYTQSDEISVLLTDFATPNTDAWFDGNLQKMASVSASIMTAEFNRLRIKRYMTYDDGKTYIDMNDFGLSLNNWTSAYFDARAFTIPDRIEVMNYFRWRQQDCIRNSVSMVAQSLYSHKELHGKSTSDMHEMIHQKGKNWATDFTDGEKNGRIIVKEEYTETLLPHPKNILLTEPFEAVRSRWTAKGAWVFTQDEGKLLGMIPTYPE